LGVGKGGALLFVKMISTELSTWLLGIGGYAGLFGSFALMYLYPNFPAKYFPALFLVPVASAAALYLFFQVLYIILEFVSLVLSAMLNEHITVILLSLTLVGGQFILISYVVYKNNFMNRIVLNNAVDETDENDETDELQPEMDDSGEDADNEAESDAPKCAGCTDDCTKCSTSVVSTSASMGISGETNPNVVCEDGVCRIVRNDVKID